MFGRDLPPSKPRLLGVVMFLCWSAKGGSGTTVVAASLALVLSQRTPTLLVDLAGDAPAALGVAEPSGPGVTDWLTSSLADAAAFDRLAVPANADLALVPRGLAHPAIGADGWSRLAEVLDAHDRGVVVDAGTGVPPAALLERASHSLLVVRPCYLALRRAVTLGLRTTGVVLVTESQRALTARDVERALGAPVVAEVPIDPMVARSVDAGLLATRLPRSLTTALDRTFVEAT